MNDFETNRNNDNQNSIDNNNNNANGYSNSSDTTGPNFTMSNNSYYTSANNSNGYNSDPLKASNFYTESYKKPSTRKTNSWIQLVAVALISSIFGGIIVGSFFVFGVPLMRPAVGQYFEKVVPGYTTSSTPGDNGVYKKVEIQKTDSPITAIAEKVSPSIVGIKVTTRPQDLFFGFAGRQGGSEGSGIIIKSDGYIMTNHHVVEMAKDKSAKIEVYLPTQKDKPYQAKIVGSDWRTDLAVLKIEATNLPAAELGDSDELKVGDQVVAIGNPAGLELMGSVTVGYISGLNRNIPIEDIKDMKLIQTDAAINPGNSGGALVNSRGQVIGVNNAKMGGQGFEGLGFAIPMNKAKEVTDSLIEYKYVKGRPLLGITPDARFNENVAKQYNVPAGVLVADIHPLSGAYKAGIQAGDIITKVDGKQVKNRTELDEIKNKHKPGDTIPIEIYRDGQTKTVQVKLIEDTGN